MSLPSESEIRELPPEQRIRLIEMLWASFIDAPETLPISEAHLRIVRERVAEHEAHPEDAHPWSEVRSELDQE